MTAIPIASRLRRASDGALLAERTDPPYTPIRWPDAPIHPVEVYAEVEDSAGHVYRTPHYTADPALHLYAAGDPLPGGVFARPSLGYQQDAGGEWRQVASGVPCDAHYIDGVRTLLVEPEGGTDLLRNGNFEDPIPGAYWHAGSGISYLSDQELAYSGRGYLEITWGAGISRVVFPDSDWQVPVSPGDIVVGGTRTHGVEGSAECGVRIAIRRADGSSITNRHGLILSPGVWGLAESPPYTIPSDGVFATAGPIVYTPSTPTTARFDDAYLRILRAGVTTRAADSLVWPDTWPARQVTHYARWYDLAYEEWREDYTVGPATAPAPLVLGRAYSHSMTLAGAWTLDECRDRLGLEPPPERVARVPSEFEAMGFEDSEVYDTDPESAS